MITTHANPLHPLTSHSFFFCISAECDALTHSTYQRSRYQRPEGYYHRRYSIVCNQRPIFRHFFYRCLFIRILKRVRVSQQHDRLLSPSGVAHCPPQSLMCVLRSSAPPTGGAREPAAHVMRCMGAMPIALQITRTLDRGSLLPLPLPLFFQHRSPLHSAV